MIQIILASSSPVYPIWALIMAVLSLVLVPRKDYQYLLPHGILGGAITGFFLILQTNYIKGWIALDAFPFTFLNVSVFIIVAWGFTKIIFLWSLPKDIDRWTHYLYIALYAMVGVVIGSVFHNLGLRPHAPWYSGWMWFFPLYFFFWIDYKIYLLRLKLSKVNNPSPK